MLFTSAWRGHGFGQREQIELCLGSSGVATAEATGQPQQHPQSPPAASYPNILCGDILIICLRKIFLPAFKSSYASVIPLEIGESFCY